MFGLFKKKDGEKKAPEPVSTKKEKRLAVIVEMDAPLDVFPSEPEENNDKTSK